MSMKIPPAWKEEGRKLGKAALKGALNNWGFKLLALFLAVVLWAGLISQDPTLTREKTFNDVTINLTNTETIKRNGFVVVTDMTELLKHAVIEVDVPQMQYDNAQASFYNVRVDLSKITQTGVQEVKVTATNSSTYGAVKSISPATITIEVEDYVTRYRIPVGMEVVGEAPEGFQAGYPSPDPPLVAVSGPRSQVEKVARAKVIVDQSLLPAREGQVRTAVPFTLMDMWGEPVDSSLLEVTSESVLLDSVVLEQQVYATREINLNDMALLSGTPAEGYEVKSISVTPETITVAGEGAVLEKLDSIFPDGSVNVSGLSESFTQQLRVRRPSDINSMSSETVTVAVEIGPIITERTFSDVKVKLSGLGEGLEGEMSDKNADVTVQGPKLWVDKLRGNALTLSCDVDGLKEGVHEVPVTCTVEASNGQSINVDVMPATITVTITGK